ncbi:hypothetical protein MBLNU459_g2517t1 [Dothideomycetes sp. NU459]
MPGTGAEDAPDPQMGCRFFALPLELRDTIYSLMLAQSDVPKSYGDKIKTKLELFRFFRDTWPGLPQSDEERFKIQPNFLCTCRLMRQEASPLFYASTDLVLPVDKNKCLEKLTSIEPENLSHVRSVVVLCYECRPLDHFYAGVRINLTSRQRVKDVTPVGKKQVCVPDIRMDQVAQEVATAAKRLLPDSGSDNPIDQQKLIELHDLVSQITRINRRQQEGEYRRYFSGYRFTAVVRRRPARRSSGTQDSSAD